MVDRNNSLPLSPSFQAERQARTERSLIIEACMRGAVRRFAGWLRVLAVWGIRLMRDLAAKRLLRSAMRELHRIDDRTLADFGVTRAEIESTVRNGLPTRPTNSGNTIGTTLPFDSRSPTGNTPNEDIAARKGKPARLKKAAPVSWRARKASDTRTRQTP